MKIIQKIISILKYQNIIKCKRIAVIKFIDMILRLYFFIVLIFKHFFTENMFTRNRIRGSPHCFYYWFFFFLQFCTVEILLLIYLQMCATIISRLSTNISSIHVNARYAQLWKIINDIATVNKKQFSIKFLIYKLILVDGIVNNQ